METVKAPLLQLGVAVRILAGQTVLGDLHLVQPFDQGCLVSVVDGLGHGEEAARAARQAVAILTNNATASVLSLIRECHDALRDTRGVVMSVASFSHAEQTMTWAGVGNVEGVLLRKEVTASPARELLLSRGGMVGRHLPPLAASVIAVSPGDTLIFATDGVRGAFWQDIHPEEQPQKMAERILASHGRETDDALVVAARYMGCTK